MADDDNDPRERRVSSASDDREWVKVQKKTFTAWVNDRLKDTDSRVKDLQADFSDGVTLIKLMQCLVPDKKFPKHTKNPRMEVQKTENLSIVFQFMVKTEKIPLVNIGPVDITEHNLKLILGLVWTLILRYQLGIGQAASQADDASKTEKDKKKKGGAGAGAKKTLLAWVQSVLPHAGVTNFQSDWNDGRKLSALVDRMKPGLIPDHEQLKPENALDNTRKAMDLAEEHFGIPKVIEPKDLCVSKPDELSVITYVSYYCSQNSPGKNALLEWINSKIPEHKISNFTSDWKNGLAIGCLTDVVSGGMFPDYEGMNPDDALENARKAMDFAEASLGVPQGPPKSITPEQFTDPTLDPLPMMSYLTYFQYVTPPQEPHMGLTASGPGISPSGDTAGKETNFVIRGRIPEWAQLGIQVTGPDGEPVKVSQGSPIHNSISCYYTPKQAGPHTVSIQLNGHHIPRSPFSSTHREPPDAGKCRITLPDNNLIVGKKTEMTADCKNGGPGQLQVEVRGPGGNIGTEVTEIEPQCYAVKFVPMEAGPHSVSVLWAGNDVGGSPLSCQASDPKKCSASGPGLTVATVNHPANFTVQTQGAGPGPLDVKISGPGGPVPVKVDKEDGALCCSYTPTENGQHQVEVNWAGVPVTGSPFRVLSSVQVDASKCRVEGLPSGFLRVGKEYDFVVVTKGAGDGTLDASGRGASLPMKCQVRSRDVDSSIISFSPQEVGKLTVEPTFAEVPIPGTPLTFKVNDPSKCKVNAAALEQGKYKAKQPIDFRVSAQFAGEGEINAKVYGPKGEKDADIKDQGDSSYLIQFTPFNLGPHSIDITFDGEQIPNVPVRFFVDREESGANDVVVTQPAPGKLGVFVVDNRYDYQLNASGANEGELSASAYGIGSGSKPKLSVINHGDGQFTVAIKAEVPDDYAVSIKWGEDQVPGSPFNIAFVAKPDASRVRVNGPHSATAAEPVSLECNTRDAGAGTISATCRGKKAGSVPTEVQEKGDKKFNVVFSPPEEDVYTLNVFFADEHVPGSSFKINLLPTDAGKVVVTKPSKIALSCRAVFKVDATEAGPGELSAFCQGESSPNLPVGINKKDSDVEYYDVDVTPVAEDKYHVYILWDKKEVPGCPFEVNLHPKVFPERVRVTVPWENSITEPFCIVDASEAGPGKVTAFCNGDKYGTVDNVKIKSLEEQGKYKVSFTPLGDDDYYMSISFDYKSTPGSPFLIPVKPVSEPMIALPVKEQEVFSEYPFEFHEPPKPEVSAADEMHLFMNQPLSVDVEPPPAVEGAEVAVDVTVTAEGDQAGPVDIQIEKDPATGVYKVYFNPPMPDRYVIELKNNGVPLPQSPIVVVYKNPPEVIVIGAPGEEDRPMAGEEVAFDVDATRVGLGELKVTSDGPSLGENDSPNLEVTEDKDQKGLYHVKHVPMAPGKHRIHINLDGKPIADSPVCFEVAGSAIAGEEHAYPYGKPVVFDVSAECHSKDLRAYAIYDPTKDEFKVKISKARKGHFNLSFDPKQPGLYFLHLQLKGKEIQGSPYRIRYMEPPDATKVKIVMTPSNVAYVNQVVMFHVDATEAGSGKLVMRALTRKKAKQEAPQLTVVDNNDGTFTAQCTTFIPTVYTFDVLWSEVPVPNSPFTITVLEQPPEIHHLLSRHLNILEIGRSLDIYFNLKDEADKDSIKGLAVGAEYGEAEVKVQLLEDRHYRAHFHATIVDEYSMEVMFKGKPLENSPFPIKVVPLGALEPQSEVENPCYVAVGKNVNLLPSTGILPSANLQVDLEGPPDSDALPIVNRDLKHGQFAVEFKPDQPGDYLVHVQTERGPINGSPFRVTAKKYKSDASKCVIVDEDKDLFAKAVRFGKPCQFRISTANAGPGVLNITSRGPAKAEVKIFDNNDGTYTCDFAPTVPGRYAVDVLWDEQHIPGSPYELKFKEKKRRMVSGLNLDQENFKVNVPHRFKLHTADIGDGILEVRCHPPSAAQIKVSLASGTTYQIEIVPKVVGHHEVIVLYNGSHLLGSPFTVTFSEKGDASKCLLLSSDVEHMENDQEHVVFIIGTQGAGTGELTAYVESQGSTERQPVTIDRQENDEYKVHFDLGEGSEYSLTVKYDGHHIEGSPFKLLFQEQGEVSLCTAEGDGLASSQVGKVATFDVMTEGDAGALKVTIEGDNSIVIDPKIENVGESTYRVTYVPSSPGQYAISVHCGDSPIQGSPFNMRSYLPAKSSDVVLVDPPAEGFVEVPVEFEVDASKIEEDGELSVVALSKKHELTGSVSRGEDRHYKCSLNIDKQGKYLVKVAWNGEHVTGSPFKLKMGERPRPDLVKAYGPGLVNGYVGQEGNFTLETGQAGSGTLAVRVHGPRKGYQINMRRHPDNDRTILVRYDPKFAGEYTVDITWSSVHVPGSPFKVQIQEQQEKGFVNGDVEKTEAEVS